jgi:hypothetical protein
MADEVEITETTVDAPNSSPGIPLEILLSRRPRKVYSGMWGLPEILVAAVGSVALLGAILLYMFVVVPSNRELAKNRLEADRLDAELTSAKTKYGEITSTEEQVAKLLTSVDDFETRYLPAATNGRGALYQRLNGLIASYGLTNTTGPDYAPLEPAEQKVGNQTDEERGREKYRSLFPGVYVTMTLEGPYQNLRRFIREIETGNEFVIISSIELEPSDTEQKKPENGAPPQQAAGAQPGGIPLGTMADLQGAPKVTTVAGQPPAGTDKPGGKTRGETVALRLEMAAYFRRANYAPIGTPAASQ